MNPALREGCARAVHVLTTDGRILRGGRATLFVLEGLGFRWISDWLSIPPLLWIVECGYWIVARNRGLVGRLLFPRG